MADSQGLSIRRLNPPELGAPPGYSQVVEVRAGRVIFIAGQTALDADGELVGKNDFAAQAEQVFRNLSAALQAVGCTASNLVKLTVFLRDMGQLSTYREARNRFFATVSPPAAPAITLIEVSKLYGPDFLIEIEAVAAI
jgi:enamine deaminase RidA (YjgF/YER057c/UK114 family)